MKTTIIDILNKIANGEEPPKKILFESEEYVWNYVDKTYYCCDHDRTDLLNDYVITDILNDEVEILEATITMKADQSSTEETNKIEKLGFENCTTPKSANENEAFLMTCINFSSMKIDELIEKVNKLL